jgi:hypothetical protein
VKPTVIKNVDFVSSCGTCSSLTIIDRHKGDLLTVSKDRIYIGCTFGVYIYIYIYRADCRLINKTICTEITRSVNALKKEHLFVDLFTPQLDRILMIVLHTDCSAFIYIHLHMVFHTGPVFYCT